MIFHNYFSLFIVLFLCARKICNLFWRLTNLVCCLVKPPRICATKARGLGLYRYYAPRQRCKKHLRLLPSYVAGHLQYLCRSSVVTRTAIDLTQDALRVHTLAPLLQIRIMDGPAPTFRCVSCTVLVECPWSVLYGGRIFCCVHARRLAV